MQYAIYNMRILIFLCAFVSRCCCVRSLYPPKTSCLSGKIYLKTLLLSLNYTVKTQTDYVYIKAGNRGL